MIGSILAVGGISLFFFFLSVLMIYAIVRSWWMLDLRRSGVTVEGHITHRDARTVGAGVRGGRIGTAYYVTYGYDYQGKTCSHEQEVDEISYLFLSEGRLVSVRCAAHHPTVALLEGPASERVISGLKPTLIVCSFVAVFCLVGACGTLGLLITILSGQ